MIFDRNYMILLSVIWLMSDDVGVHRQWPVFKPVE